MKKKPNIPRQYSFRHFALILVLLGSIPPATAQEMPHTSYSLQKAEFADDSKNAPDYPEPGKTRMFTAFTVNKPETNTIIFRDNGDFIFHGHQVAKWEKWIKGKDSMISFNGFTDNQLLLYYQYTNSAKTFYKGDTLILSYNKALFYYIPYTKALTLPKHDDRRIYDGWFQNGIDAEIKYSSGITGEFGYSFSEEFDSMFMMINLTGSYNPSQKIYGAHFKICGSYFGNFTHVLPIFFGIDINSLFKNRTFDIGIMPEAGINLGFIWYPLRNIALTYGYDLFLVNHHITGVDNNVFGLRLNLPLQRSKYVGYYLDGDYYDDKY